MKLPTMDALGFSCVLLNPVNNVQELIYLAMHQCYSEQCVADEVVGGNFKRWSESDYGEAIVKHILPYGHFGPLEEGHQFMFSVGGAVHSLVMQLRTHRTGISFDVQSGRYTGKRFVDVANGKRDVEEVFYFRPIGFYRDRKGKNYEYTHQQREVDKTNCAYACRIYRDKINAGYAEEHARDMLPQNFRQAFTFSANLRTLLHLDSMRNKGDAQMEVQVLMKHINNILTDQAPEVMGWWNNKSKRLLAA